MRPLRDSAGVRQIGPDANKGAVAMSFYARRLFRED